jgi:hypothetical protein
MTEPSGPDAAAPMLDLGETEATTDSDVSVPGSDAAPELQPGDAWDLAGRDTVLDLTPKGGPSDAGSAMLYGLLKSEGAVWKPPYDPVREALGIRKKTVIPEYEDRAASRVRTWMVHFRNLGLVYDDEGHLRVTELGHQFRDVLDAMFKATDSFAAEAARANRIKIARVVGPALARYQLRTPLNASRYSPDVDIHPLWAIWKSARVLDGKIHWDELDRTLTKCLRMSDLDATIEQIRIARLTPGYDPADPAILESLLGSRYPVVSDSSDRPGQNQRDRVIPWLARAAFRDMFLERENRADGYRYLNDEFLPLLDELLATPPEDFDSTQDPAAYFQWLGQASPLAANVGGSPFEGTALLHQVVERCREFGDRRIIALIGPAGSGKTALAREAALTLTDSDTTRVEIVQFHAAFTYEEFVGGLAPLPGGGFAPSPGVLVDINRRAAEHPEQVYVLVIDEISRADTANVLGELLTYVEYRDRSFRVPALNESIKLAANLVIIATMNPADRSVINMDDALVRRLRQISVPRSTDALRAILGAAGMSDGLRAQVCDWFDGLPADAPFGHGLFVDVTTEQDLYYLWHEQLTFFLRRGGLSVYSDPARIEEGFLWRMPQYASDLSGATDGSEVDGHAEPNGDGQAQGEPESELG